jgi:hypothetical protein
MLLQFTTLNTEEGHSNLLQPTTLSVIYEVIMWQRVKVVTKRAHFTLLFPNITTRTASSLKSHLWREVCLEFKHEMKEYTSGI